MTISDDNKPEILDVPVFLRDPQPSNLLRCPTLLVAWLRKTGEPPEPERDACATGDDTECRFKGNWTEIHPLPKRFEDRDD